MLSELLALFVFTSGGYLAVSLKIITKIKSREQSVIRKSKSTLHVSEKNRNRPDKMTRVFNFKAL